MIWIRFLRIEKLHNGLTVGGGRGFSITAADTFLIEGAPFQVLRHSGWTLVGVAVGVTKSCSTMITEDVRHSAGSGGRGWLKNFGELPPNFGELLGLESPSKACFLLSLLLAMYLMKRVPSSASYRMQHICGRYPQANKTLQLLLEPFLVPKWTRQERNSRGQRIPHSLD